MGALGGGTVGGLSGQQLANMTSGQLVDYIENKISDLNDLIDNIDDVINEKMVKKANKEGQLEIWQQNLEDAEQELQECKP